MPCFYPLNGWRSNTLTSKGKRKIVFTQEDAFRDRSITVPCGQCIGCRLEYSRQWAVRCMHENQLHDESCFITLTYNDKNLPENGVLIKKDFQDFMKRLRKNISPIKVKFFSAGEYGEVCEICGLSKKFCLRSECKKFIPTFGRPHYHALIFGYDFKDKKIIKEQKLGNEIVKLYRSETLEKMWQKKGHVTIGQANFLTAAYVARYCLKKATGKKKEEGHYDKVNIKTGEIITMPQEYITMSRGGRTGKGISSEWYDKYKSEVFPSDSIVVNGQEMRPPKYYDNMFEIENNKKYKEVKFKRRLKAKLEEPERVYETEKVAQAKLNLNKRHKEI